MGGQTAHVFPIVQTVIGLLTDGVAIDGNQNILRCQARALRHPIGEYPFNQPTLLDFFKTRTKFRLSGARVFEV